MGQKDGRKWTAAVDSQPTIAKSDRLLAIMVAAPYRPPAGLDAGQRKRPHTNHRGLTGAKPRAAPSRSPAIQPFDFCTGLASSQLAG